MLKLNSVTHKYGYTLIELIVTCSIIALLALISIPAYTKYRLTGKVATMIAAAADVEFAVSNDYFNNGYVFTNTNFAAGSQPFLIPQVDFITSISVTNGVISITGDADNLNGNQINFTFTPAVTNNSITWTCAVDPAFYIYVPVNCRNPI